MNEKLKRQRRRLIGMGFVLAFGLSTATIILTGLNVRAPGSAPLSEDSAAPNVDAETLVPSAAEETAPDPSSAAPDVSAPDLSADGPSADQLPADQMPGDQ